MADTNPITDALSGLATNAAKPERSEPGPGDVGPSTETKGPTTDLVSLKMTEEEAEEWWKRIERSRARRKAREDKWDLLLNEYMPVVSKSGEAETVKVQTHFRNVHTKMGQLFYRAPDLVLTPDDPGPAQNKIQNPMAAMAPPGSPPPAPLTLEDIISGKQAMLTKKMGRDGIKANRLMDELLFDVLAWTGIGCSKIGYRCVMKDIPQPVMGPDPNWQPPVPPPGSMLGLSAPSQPPQVPQMGPDGQPQMQNQPVPIYEEWYHRRFSPKKYLCNDDLRSTRFEEDATWQGMEFFMSPKKAMGVFKLTEEEASKAAEDDRVHLYDDDKGDKPAGLVHGIEIWLKSSIYTDELHPLAYTQLVMIEGIKDRPVVYRPSPDQTFDPQTGKLTPDSLVGNPIRVLTIRDLADSCYPPADAAFTNSGIKQLSTWRRQSIKMRDVNIGKFLADSDMFEDEDIEQIKNGETGEIIFVKGGALANGADKVIAPMSQIHMTPDDYRGEALIKQDIDETLGISAAQSGVPEPTVRTATETATVNSSVTARNDKELSRVVDFYLDNVRMLDQLLMRYADNNEWIQVIGEDGASKMQMWSGKMGMGKYLYEIAPDSQMRMDSAREMQLDMQLYNIAGKDPLFNRLYALKRLTRARGWDPSKATIDPSTIPPPAPKPVVPAISFAFKGPDLADPLVLQIIEKAELISPPGDPTQQQPQQHQGAKPGLGPIVKPKAQQPPHPGASEHMETLSQHMASNSGGRPNEPGSTNTRETQVK